MDYKNQVQQFFENLALDWDESQPVNREQIIHNLLTNFDEKIRLHRSILEIGTGTGALIPILGERYPSAKVTSIDIAHNMLTRAKKRAPNAYLIQCDVHQMPFVNETFDIAICHNCFPHFCQQSFALLEIKRTLINQGELLILHDISREHVNQVHQKAQNSVIHDHILPEAKTLVKRLEQTGFSTKALHDSSDYFIIYAKSH